MPSSATPAPSARSAAPPTSTAGSGRRRTRTVLAGRRERGPGIAATEPRAPPWCSYPPAGESEDLRTVGADFQAFVHLLEAEQIEYDLGSAKTLQEVASTSHGKVNVG